LSKKVSLNSASPVICRSGSHRDARRLHVHEQEADALVLGRARIGPHEQEAPVRDVAHARPDLLAVHDVVIAVSHRAGLEVREVGARVGLGEALAPHLVGGEDVPQMALLLLRRAVLHQGGAEHRDAAAIHDLRRLGASHLLIKDHHLGEARASAAELGRPVHADVAGLVHRPLPRAQPHEFFPISAGRGERLPFQVIG
jgi:hypothetical protein